METTDTKVAICCIAKNEDRYIDEWIEYHLGLGFDKIYVFRDDWDWVGRKDYGGRVVSGNALRVKNPQIPMYNHFLYNYGAIYDWVLFIDVDEFLVLKTHNNVKSYLKAHCGNRSIGLNWVLFGSKEFNHGAKNGVFDDKRGVLDRFRYRQRGVNQHVKCFMRCGVETRMLNPHFGNEEWLGSDGRHHWGAFCQDGSDKEAYIAHFFTKSWPEWCEKRDRGRADLCEKRSDDDFFKHDINEIYEHIGSDK